MHRISTSLTRSLLYPFDSFYSGNFFLSRIQLISLSTTRKSIPYVVSNPSQCISERGGWILIILNIFHAGTQATFFPNMCWSNPLFISFRNENIYWYEARVLSLEPGAPRIGRTPNCERRSPLRNPYPKSIILFRIYVRMRR